MITTTEKICCVAGSSGGHIIPCLQFAKINYSQNPTIIFISTTKKLDITIIQQFSEIADHLTLSVYPIPYKKWWQFPFFIISFIKNIYTSFAYLKKERPSKIVSTGGLIAIPVIFAARLLNIPADLFELNVIPGKATSFISRWSTNLFICFKETKKYFKKSCTFVSYPVRFTTKDLISTKNDCIQKYKFNVTKKTIFILGGSQGSEFLNNFIQTLPIPVLQTFNIIHQTGSAHIDQCKEFYKKHHIVHFVFDYQHTIAPFYHASDLIICRAGAGTLFETLFFKKQCIIIPLETSITDHQLNNAQAFSKEHPDFFSFFRQKDLIFNPDQFIKALKKQLANHPADKKS